MEASIEVSLSGPQDGGTLKHGRLGQSEQVAAFEDMAQGAVLREEAGDCIVAQEATSIGDMVQSTLANIAGVESAVNICRWSLWITKFIV